MHIPKRDFSSDPPIVVGHLPMSFPYEYPISQRFLIGSGTGKARMGMEATAVLGVRGICPQHTVDGRTPANHLQCINHCK